MSRALKYFAADDRHRDCRMTLSAGRRFAGPLGGDPASIVIRGLRCCNDLQCAGTVRILAGLKLYVRWETESFGVAISQGGGQA